MTQTLNGTPHFLSMREPLFTPAPFFFARIPVCPIEQCDYILSANDWLKVLTDYYETTSLFREAILVASPSLYTSLSKREGKISEQCGGSLLNYALRMGNRATPFGLFSCVAMGQWSSSTNITFNMSHTKKRARPDMDWVHSLVQNLYQNEWAFKSLSVRANPLSLLQGNRLYVTYLLYSGERDKESDKKVSIRLTQLIKTILSFCREPIKIDQLLEKLSAHIPNLDLKKTEELLKKLYEQQILIPTLLPSLLEPRQIENSLHDLASNLVQKICNYNETLPSEGEDILQQLYKEMEAIKPSKAYLQIDTAYNTPLSLQQEIADELGSAVELLWKISSAKNAFPYLTTYHTRFLEKYGTQRTIPLLELLQNEKGLGAPEYDQPLTTTFESKYMEMWEKWLDQAWQEAMRNGDNEIIIDDSLVDQFRALDKHTYSEGAAPLSLDAFCKILAHSQEDIDNNKYQILLSQVTWQGCSSIGRFLDILPQAQSSVHSFLKKEEELEPDALFFEVSYWPSPARSANVAIHPCLRNYRLDVLSIQQSDQELSLEDIYVGATLKRLYLTRKDGKKEIIATRGNVLNRSFAPTPIRFMLDVSLARNQLILPFSWGRLEDNAVFLPRVRYGKTILSPAIWNYLPLHPENASPDEMLSILKTWAEKWRLPKRFVLIKGDQLQLMDREHPAHMKEIALQMKKKAPLRFMENLNTAWIQGDKGHHTSEIVISYVKSSAFAKRDESFTPQAFNPISHEERWKNPGSDWLFIKLYVAKESMDRFLLEHINPFTMSCAQKNAIHHWFFIRYYDPDPHLRIRMQIASQEQFNHIIPLLGERTTRWIKNGLIKNISLNSYEREIERYGGIELIDEAEKVFCADSLSTIHLLQASLNNRSKITEPVLRTVSAISFLKGFGLHLREMIELLQNQDIDSEKLEGFRQHKHALITFTKALDEECAPAEIAVLKEAASIREPFQKQYCLKAHTLPPSELFAIYDSMLHMHYNRLGCDLKEEQQSRIYALHTLRLLEKHTTYYQLPKAESDN